MRKILLPTDFSDNAWNAISYALEFFKDEKCIFYFLHTYTPSFYRLDYMMGGPEFSAISDNEVEISVAGLEKSVTDAKKQFPNKNHTYKTVSAFNTLTHEINEFSERKDIDLVVMGTKGATGAKQLFLGSNTVFVIRKANVPVLVIPDGCRYVEIKQILFPTDYWSGYKKDEVGNIIDLSRIHTSKITILHVKEEYDLTDGQLKNKSVLENIMNEVPHKIEEVKGKLMPEAILDYIEENKIDLLTMMNQGHSFFEHILIKQNIDQIGFHVKIPFLVVPDTSKVSKS
jgi:nucleotide-binding universal stress UspA family protein